MRFSVITSDETEHFWDGSYTISEAGVLVVKPDDTSEERDKTISLSPHYWHMVNAPRKGAATVSVPRRVR